MSRLTTALTAITQRLELCGLAGTVHVSAGDLQHDVVVQLCGCDLAASAANLLHWSSTILDPHACAWRPEGGIGVHLDVTGTIPPDLTVRVYAGVDYSPDRFPDLGSGGRQNVGLSVLRAWAAEAVAA